VPVTLAAAALVLYALFSRRAEFERRRMLTLAGAALAGVAGLAVLLADFGVADVVGALVSALSGAIGGWVAGFGYARAGGDDMIPPGSTIRPRGPRPPRRTRQGRG
jgi:hypothetical protein